MSAATKGSLSVEAVVLTFALSYSKKGRLDGRTSPCGTAGKRTTFDCNQSVSRNEESNIPSNLHCIIKHNFCFLR